MAMNRGKCIPKVAMAGALLVALIAATAHAQQATARALVERALQTLPRVAFAAKLRLTTDLGEVRKFELKHKIVEGTRSTYLQVTAPEAIKGIRFLFLEPPDGPPEQYIKVTAARSSVRVASHVRRRPFLGSTFYVADMVEPEVEAYTYRFVGEQEILGRNCRLVESTPKNPEEEIYGKVVAAIDPADLLVLRRNFFDHQGEVMKVWTVEKLEKVQGYWTLMDQKMSNLQEKTESRLQTIDIKYDVDIDDLVFSPKYLLR